MSERLTEERLVEIENKLEWAKECAPLPLPNDTRGLLPLYSWIVRYALDVTALLAEHRRLVAENAVLMIAAREHWENCDMNLPDNDGNLPDDSDLCPICTVVDAEHALSAAAPVAETEGAG